MALATRCPHCKTTFRVAADQLKLRGGIVRCGTCSQVFDGNASLVELDALVRPRRHEPVVPFEEQGDTSGNTIMAQELTDVETAAPQPPPKSSYVLDYDLSEPESVDFDLSEPDGWTSTAQAQLDEPAERAPAASLPPSAASAPVAVASADLAAKITPAFPADASGRVAANPEPVWPPAPAPAAPVIAAPAPVPAAAYVTAGRQHRDAAKDHVNHDHAAEEHDRDDDDPFDHDASLELDLDPAALAAHDFAIATTPVVEPEDWPSPQELDHAPDLEHGPLPLVRESAPSEYVEPAPVFVVEPVHKEPPPPEHDEPEFVRLHREKELNARRRRLMLGAGSAVLALVLLAQVVTNYRNTLAAQFPSLTPALAASCKVLGCKVELPAQIEHLSIETGELQSLSPTSFQLTTLLTNQGSLVQAWPSIELELTDTHDKAVVRRVFTPEQYLPATVQTARGFAGKSEQPVKIQFELKQVKASGFHIAVFYP